MAKKTERYDYAIREDGNLDEREGALHLPSRDNPPDDHDEELDEADEVQK